MDTFASLSAFVEVVECGGFAPAARRLGVATSSVTRQVDALEAQLGTQLLNRSTRRVTVTPAGEEYFEHAQRILMDLDSVNQAISERVGPPKGVIRASLPVAFARLHVAPLVPSFLQKYSDVRLDLVLSDRVADLVGERLDMAIRLGGVDAPNLVARRLAPHRRVLCASPGYLRERGQPMSPTDLAEHDCLVFSYSSGNRLWHFSGRSNDSVRVTGRLQSNNSEMLREAAICGAGILLMPSWLVGADIETGRLQCILPQWRVGVEREEEGAINAVYLANRRKSKPVRAFVDHLIEGFGSPPYWEWEDDD